MTDRRAFALAILWMLAAPLSAFAQRSESSDDEMSTPLRSARSRERDPETENPSSRDQWERRTLLARYGDALAGSWAATGIAAGGGAVLGTGLGAGIGCLVQAEIGCVAGAWIGGVALTSVGWIAGPGIGSAHGAGLDFGEGLAIWALGLLTHGALFGTATLVGVVIDESGQTWGLGRVWGMIIGLITGALGQVFVTPFYAVAIFPERPPAEAPELTIVPFVAPSELGATGGVFGAF